MQALIDVILPVFLVIGFGYVAVWRGWFSNAGVDGLMAFTQHFAVPCLLFRALWTLDLGQHFDFAMLTSFYTGSVTSFTAGLLGARFLFGRDWEDAVAIGFTCLFTNSVLIGLPITERAYGAEALEGNFAIVALHSPICYGIGITAMELVRARKQGSDLHRLPFTVLRAMFRNALVIGIALGAGFNIAGVSLPAFFTDAIDIMVRAALPAALFAVGGVLYRYRPEGDLRIIAYVCAISLVLHPAITWTLGTAFKLDVAPFRSAVLTASMAPGINGYVFASMYGRGMRVAASSVLLATALSIGTVWVWLGILP